MRQILARHSDVRPSVTIDIVETTVQDSLAEWPTDGSLPAPVKPTSAQDWLAEFAVEPSAVSDPAPTTAHVLARPTARQEVPPARPNHRRSLGLALPVQHMLRRWPKGVAVVAVLLVSGLIGWSLLDRRLAPTSDPATVLPPSLFVPVPAAASAGTARESVQTINPPRAHEVWRVPDPIPLRDRDGRAPQTVGARGADRRRVPQVVPPRGADGRRAAQATISKDPATVGVATPVAPTPAAPASLPVTGRPTAPLDSVLQPRTSPPLAPPPPAAASATATSSAALPAVSEPPLLRAGETPSVLALVDRYRRAFSALDAAAVEAVWLGIDGRALRRAFDRLEQQSFEFDRCLIEFSGSQAVASCYGTVRYVPKVGSKTPRVESRRWTFTLAKVNDAWMIQRVDSRQGR